MTHGALRSEEAVDLFTGDVTGWALGDVEISDRTLTISSITARNARSSTAYILEMIDPSVDHHSVRSSSLPILCDDICHQEVLDLLYHVLLDELIQRTRPILCRESGCQCGYRFDISLEGRRSWHWWKSRDVECLLTSDAVGMALMIVSY